MATVDELQDAVSGLAEALGRIEIKLGGAGDGDDGQGDGDGAGLSEPG